ncbi:MAG TPA: DUF1876 domain-containing protein [Pilimelia sp.]|nr:DUF1876 domain-containing protein [Pilimelia sp.]
MNDAKQWTIDVRIEEHEESRQTRAEVQLRSDAALVMTGVGAARRNPADRDVPVIGDELAVARALFDLGHHLLESAAHDIESSTHQRATVHA